MGKDIANAAKDASKVSGVTKVLTLENALLENPVAEDLSPIVTSLAKKYTHILTSSTMFSKNYIPRAAAILDSAPLHDVTTVIDENTFEKPIYAGNAIATVKMNSPNKVCFSLLLSFLFAYLLVVVVTLSSLLLSVVCWLLFFSPDSFFCLPSAPFLSVFLSSF
jgi:electron transfer flavoprotein alpha subunit